MHRLACLILVFAWGSMIWADPTSKQPSRTFELHRLCRLSTELAEACEELNALLAPRNALYEQAILSGTTNGIPINELGVVYGKTEQMLRYGNLLIGNAEPGYVFAGAGFGETAETCTADSTSEVIHLAEDTDMANSINILV